MILRGSYLIKYRCNHIVAGGSYQRMGVGTGGGGRVIVKMLNRVNTDSGLHFVTIIEGNKPCLIPVDRFDMIQIFNELPGVDVYPFEHIYDYYGVILWSITICLLGEAV